MRTNAMKHVDIANNSSVDGIFIATTYANKRTKGKTTREQAQVPRTPEDQCWHKGDGSKVGRRCNNLFRPGGGCVRHCRSGTRTSTAYILNIELGGEGGIAPQVCTTCTQVCVCKRCNDSSASGPWPMPKMDMQGAAYKNIARTHASTIYITNARNNTRQDTWMMYGHNRGRSIQQQHAESC